MSAARELLEDLRGLGVALRFEGDRLRYSGPREVITADVLDRLREHRREVAALLEPPRPAYAEKVNGIYVHRGNCQCEWCHFEPVLGRG